MCIEALWIEPWEEVTLFVSGIISVLYQKTKTHKGGGVMHQVEESFRLYLLFG